MSGFYNLENYQYKKYLEDNASTFEREIGNIPFEILIAWHETSITKGEWLMAPVVLCDLQLPPIISQLLPNTLEILGKTPVIQATVSVLKAGAEILPHSDNIYNDVLLSSKTYRLQLGIDIPENCALSVENDQGEIETRYWENGKVLAFDSSHTHSAYNRSDRDRIVLIVDYCKDDESISEEELLALKSYYLNLYNMMN